MAQTATELAEVDRDALERALIGCCARDPIRAKQIEDMLASRPREEILLFAAYNEQMDNLNLESWQGPPMWSSPFDLALPYGDISAKRENAELLRRLQDAGLSMYEPDPFGALEAKSRKEIENALAVRDKRR